MSIDAMKRALEALEKVKDMAWSEDTAEGRKTIEALRAAIEQAEKREWVGLTPEEVKEISLANRPYVVDMVVALEQRLKEKNT